MSKPRPPIVDALAFGLAAFVTVWLIVGFEAAAISAFVAIMAVDLVGRSRS